MLDKIVAAVCLATLIGFMGIVAFWINEIDLWIIVSIVLVMAAFDFIQTAGRSGSDKKSG